MAGKRDPSIYDERTTIGSADNLDEYGVWVKSESQEIADFAPDIEELPEFDDFMSDTKDLPTTDTSFDTAPDINFEAVDLDSVAAARADNDDDFDFLEAENSFNSIEFEEIPESSDLPEGLAPTSIDGDGFTEVSMNDFFSTSSGKKKTEVIDFGDLDGSVNEIKSVKSSNSTSSFSSDDSPASDMEEQKLSTQLLQRIADELSSIKKEITGLKKELSVVRGEIRNSESGDGKGFFDEEDDEKIALTGDELDNILNTADFTEETGAGEMDISFEADSDVSEETISFDEDVNFEDNEVKTEDISFDEELSELDGAVSVEDEIKTANNDDFDISLDLSPESNELNNDGFSELDILREEGAAPITTAPEDTSYLEEDSLVSFDEIITDSDDPFSETIDISGAVIDEPDLSAHITENPVSEPSIDDFSDNISIDFEMEEAVKEPVSDSNDFIFEAEDTMEIPISEFADADDIISMPDSGDEAFSSETMDFAETAPKELYDLEASPVDTIPDNLKQELKVVLTYMDQLLESLPDDKIEEFAQSEYFETYKKLFEELGLV